MFSVADTDTVIGVVMGPDVGIDAVGAATKWLVSFQKWAGWTGRPMAGSYVYPNYTNSDWVLKNYQGVGAMCWGSMLIPQTVISKWANPKKASASEAAALMADVRAGKYDATWKALATSMVANGHTDGIYRTGFEGNGNNFAGSAGQIGDANYAEIMERHLGVMLSVTGWNYLPEWNYSVLNAQQNGLNPDRAWCRNHIGVVGMDVYDVGGYSMQGWTAAQHDVVWKSDILPQLEAQARFADKHGLRIGVTEFGPLWKSDGHGGADARYFLDHFYGWIMANAPMHAFLFNGSNLPGDEARVAVPTSKTSFIFADNPRYPTAAPAVRELFDPALFVGKSSMTARAKAALGTQVTTLQTQVTSLTKQIAGLVPAGSNQAAVDAAVAAAVLPLNTKVNSLTRQVSDSALALAAATSSLANAQTALAAANDHATNSDAQVGTLTGQLSDANNHLASANAQISDLQAMIAKVKADLGIA